MAGSLDLSPLTDGSANATTTSSEQNNNSPLVAPPPTKKKRLTAKQKQDKRVDDLKQKEHFKAAHKAATKMYHEEREKGGGGMTVREVARKIQFKFGVGPSASTIHQYVADSDESELTETSRLDLEIGDTALGRLEKKRKKEFAQAATNMTDAEWNELLAARSLSSLAASLMTSTMDMMNN